MKELVGLGAVSVEHRRDGTRQLTNRYLVRTLAEEGAAAMRSPP
jgi:Holliday junction resolvase